jgi:hypothetical protein
MDAEARIAVRVRTVPGASPLAEGPPAFSTGPLRLGVFDAPGQLFRTAR